MFAYLISHIVGFTLLGFTVMLIVYESALDNLLSSKLEY